MAKVGTLAWNRDTKGLLRRRDRAALAAQAVRGQLRLLGEQGRRRLGLRAPALAALDLDGVRPPDTAAARDAEALCEEASAPFLVAHCHRSYLWGRILGAHDSVSWDDELLYVAALLHDLGLTERYADGAGPQRCFTLWGEAPSRELCGRAGWSHERCDALVEAISLHVNVSVGLEHGPEAHLLNTGTACDVAGIRTLHIDAPTRAAVLARHPRQDMKREIMRAWGERANLPGTRSRFLSTVGQLEKRANAAPFPE
jgi:hypothetical protein